MNYCIIRTDRITRDKVMIVLSNNSYVTDDYDFVSEERDKLKSRYGNECKFKIVDALPILNKNGFTSEPQQVELNDVTRVEVIDGNGRSYHITDAKNVFFQLQDNKRTLKVFITSPKSVQQ